MTYSDKLKSPKWQKKRLEIMSRDFFTCQCCKNDSRQLHVHHIIYKKGADIWDYDNDELITLCDTCHSIYHSLMEDLEPCKSVKDFDFKAIYFYLKDANSFTGIAYWNKVYWYVRNTHSGIETFWITECEDKLLADFINRF